MRVQSAIHFVQLIRYSKFVTLIGMVYVGYALLRQARLSRIRTVRALSETDVRYVGLEFKTCNGLANQMQRYAALYGIGRLLGRTPYIDSRLSCSVETVPELASSMPNFRAGLKFSKTGRALSWAVPFVSNVCEYLNASALAGKYEHRKYLKLRTNLLQSYKFFHDIKPQIRYIFDVSEETRKIVERFANELFLNNTDHKVCVHVRRGDFVDHPFLLPSKTTFVNPALRLIASELFDKHGPLSLLLIGEDARFGRYLKRNKTHFREVFVAQGLSRTEDMHFGARFCDSLLISASGSTFAWWIGYLMGESKQHRVYYNYLATKRATDCRDTFDFDTYPPEWRRLRLVTPNQLVVREPRWHRRIRKEEKNYRNWIRIT